MTSVTASSDEKIAENFKAVSRIIKRTEQCKFCMQIASLKPWFVYISMDFVTDFYFLN